MSMERQDELVRRVSNLEEQEKVLTKSLNDLTISTERIAMATETMQEAIKALAERDKKVQAIEVEIARIDTTLKVVKFLGTVIAIGFLGIGIEVFVGAKEIVDAAV
jgi:hypothetical protein